VLEVVRCSVGELLDTSLSLLREVLAEALVMDVILEAHVS
jgi:hypothetical protein